MKLRFLGTGAAEAIPALWCECELCQTAIRTGGKELRRRCSYLIDDDTLVDFGPDIYWQATEFKIDLCRIKRLVITHPHEDHLNPVELLWRVNGYSAVTRQLKIFGGKMVMTRILRETGEEFSALKSIPQVLTHGEKTVDEDFGILPMAANHAPGETPFIYVLSRGGKNLLIGNDSGYFPEESWKLLSGVKLDAAVLESTGNLRYPDNRNYHMGCNVTVETRSRLIEMGCLDKSSPVCVTHFSHNGGGSHQALEQFFGPHGITVAYDGLSIEI